MKKTDGALFDAELRHAIVHAVVKQWTDTNPMPDFEGAEHAFGMTLWKRRFSTNTSKGETGPIAFLMRADHFLVSVEGKGVITVRVKQNVPVSYAVKQHEEAIATISPLDPCYRSYQATRDAAKTWYKEQSALAHEVHSLLDAVPNLEALLDLWPDLAEILDPSVLDGGEQFDTQGRMKELNERFGLAA